MTKPEPTFAVHFTEEELVWIYTLADTATMAFRLSTASIKENSSAAMTQREGVAAGDRAVAKIKARLQQIPSRN